MRRARSSALVRSLGARMGLDTVEIVLRVEETFGVDIPDDEAGSVRTVGDLCQLVLRRLDEENLNTSFRDKEEVWRMLREIIVDQLQVDEEEVVSEADIARDLRCD